MIHKSMNLKYEPASKPLHISAQELFLNWPSSEPLHISAKYVLRLRTVPTAGVPMAGCFSGPAEKQPDAVRLMPPDASRLMPPDAAHLIPDAARLTPPAAGVPMAGCFSGTLDASRFGPVCPQVASLSPACYQSTHTCIYLH